MAWVIYHYVIHFRYLILNPLWSDIYKFMDHANQNLMPYIVVLEFCILYLVIMHIVRSLKVINLNDEQSKLLRRFIDELGKNESRKQGVDKRTL